ncbi:unnamed protein product [Paramecium primaurelia]|uniref:Uncharacterized protein n=1 Tax=Paramecium primaurelia TaxID=5886 RepID=A0A8S1PIA7_PARPR|nr:unnamed protein product [Paramecium primaurelia]
MIQNEKNDFKIEILINEFKLCKASINNFHQLISLIKLQGSINQQFFQGLQVVIYFNNALCRENHKIKILILSQNIDKIKNLMKHSKNSIISIDISTQKNLQFQILRVMWDCKRQVTLCVCKKGQNEVNGQCLDLFNQILSIFQRKEFTLVSSQLTYFPSFSKICKLYIINNCLHCFVYIGDSQSNSLDNLDKSFYYEENSVKLVSLMLRWFYISLLFGKMYKVDSKYIKLFNFVCMRIQRSMYCINFREVSSFSKNQQM